MQELIKVVQENDRLTVLGRDLHEFLEIGKDYSTWFKGVLSYGFVEGVDYLILQFPKNGESENSGIAGNFMRQKIDHQLTLDMAKEISMIQRNEKGREARKYFIECENKLKLKPLKKWEMYLELSKIEKEKELLEEQNKLNAPKVFVYDAIMDIKDTYTIIELANFMEIPPRKCSKWLRDNKFAYHNKNKQLRPYNNYGINGHNYLTLKVRLPDGNILSTAQARVTSKGLSYFVSKYKEELK